VADAEQVLNVDQGTSAACVHGTSAACVHGTSAARVHDARDVQLTPAR
jgi:hypothetical protein